MLGLRKELGLYANIRPAVLYKSLASSCPLRKDIAEKGIDMVIIRELADGGMYYGKEDAGRVQAEKRRMIQNVIPGSKLKESDVVPLSNWLQKERTDFVSVDKANVLESSRLWREVIHALSAEYPQVEVVRYACR